MTTATSVSVGPRPARRVPLSHTQRLILTGQRLHPHVPVANMAKRVRLRGPVDPDRLVRAFDTVVRACDVLRMTTEPGSLTEAFVHEQPPTRTSVVELDSGDVDRWIAERIGVPIDTSTCVYDSVLLRHADDDWTWWFDLHHVAADAWSSSLVYRATVLAYEHDDGDVSQLGDIVDGAAFDLETDEPDLDRVEGWHATLGSTAARPLAPYGQRGPSTTAVDRLEIEADLDALLDGLDDTYRSLSRELGLLAMSAMAFAHTMRRLDGRHEIVVGVPVHHRSSAARRLLVAPLMEIYPLAVTALDDETPREQFKRTLRSLMQLLRTAKPGESPGGSVEIVLNVVTAEYGAFADLDTEVEWARSGHVDADHLVRSQVFDYGGDGALSWELDVNHGLAADESWRRLPAHLGAIVDTIVRTPDERWADVSIVAADEAVDIGTGLAADGDVGDIADLEPVHLAVARRLRAEPDQIVAEQAGRGIDARTFDRRADAFAGWLLRSGVAAGSRVGLRMGRSVDMLIALHGVLRAGAAFVMLDPADPSARHDAIADDAGLALVVDALPELSDDTEPPALPDVGLDDLAYVLYTSGSTGAPKGVPISHRGLAAYLAFAADAYVDHDRPVMALHSSLVFDLTVTSLFLTFLTGGCTVVFPDDPVVALGAIARDDRITLLKATPSQLEIYTRLATPERPLRGVIVGGEAFRRPVAERLRATCRPGVRIWNEYGPTEAVVGCMIHEYDAAADVGADVPIGRAATGCELRVLDDLGHLTATGSWGELWVRRHGMADGYLHLPDLTSERFVDLDGDGRRWYRTGDRVRLERPGVLTYGGRMDDQVKVNGIRLEPAEVEAALVQHPDIDGAVVRVWSPRDRARREAQRCVRCGLGADVPGVEFDVAGVCSVCHSFDAVAPQAEAWFRTETDLDARLADVRRRHDGPIDALHLLSGGKDSTYALYQLVERGWRVHALTLDNGFISDGAKANIRRSVADLGITHEFATTDVMNEIFRDSLDRYSNVCQGCYKTIYTIAVSRARQLDIPVIVTGLSRGQFFETRLVPHQFEHGRFDPAEIDATVRAAREVYHHTPDAVTELLPEQAVFDDPDVLDRVEFLDFYRFVDVDLAELYRFLDERAPWVRPADTGRSTNCLINVAGISVHRHEQGYHNYAEPYSWDVRLGHKTRDEALGELDDEIDPGEVAELLAEVGYEPKSNEILTAWYQTADGRDLDPDELRAHLRRVLPEHAVPSAFVRLEDVPLAASAKVDVDALPAPTRIHRGVRDRIEPSTPTETRLCEIWAEALAIESVGVTDDFFDLGGSSLPALEVVAAIDVEFGTDLHDAAVFRHRTVRELAPIVDADRGDAAIDTTPIPAVGDTPLSAGEEALLFEYRAAPDLARYPVGRIYAVRGTSIDLDRWERAARDVVAHHAPLHTSYAPDRLALPIDDALSFERLPITDADDFRRFAETQNSVPFDLDDGPLVRIHVAVTGPDETSFLVAAHHISIDAGTFDLLWQQIATRYSGGELPTLDTTYAAHGAWQRAMSDRSASFWSARSAERRPTGGIGLAPPSPAAPDGYLTRSTDLRVEQLAASGGTPFAVAMAAAATTLSALTADRTVEIRITTSTKDHPSTAPLIGYFLNTLPMQTDVDPAQTFASLTRRVTDEVAAALPHRARAFAEIARDARDAGQVPPSTSFLLAYTPLSSPGFPGATVTQKIVPAATAVADVSLFVEERHDGLDLAIEYAGRVLDADAATRVLDTFSEVLARAVDSPETPVGELVTVANDLIGPPLPEPVDHVVGRFVSMVEHTPDAPAVIAGDDSVGYAELAVRVLTIAGALRASGRPVRRIGVHVGRSIDAVAAILAAQAVGAAYVPLDPTTGETRVAQIVGQADLDLMLTDGRATGLGLAADRCLDVTTLSENARSSDEAMAELRTLADAIAPEAPAYVIFTSGSTGRPRGVEVTHANLAASTAARSIWYPAPPERFLLTSSIGFDSSVVGLFWSLTTAGAIVLPSDDDVHDVDRLGDLIERHRVTHLLMVPSLYRALLRRRADRLGSLTTAIVAGEACPPDLVDEHHAAIGATVLVNEYGPTEATVWATAHRLEAGSAGAPIGSPIPGVTVRVADSSLRPVPIGVAGELLVAGPTVAAGYLDDEVATLERFVLVDDIRWYRTGDRVRLGEHGLEFVGRLDDQLNVGGVRVEPIEIERAIREVTGVPEVAVVASGEPAALVAHLETDAPVDEAVVRDALADRLPPGALPRRFLTWSQLPRSAHGKLDRTAAAALPIDDRNEVSAAPATEVDRMVDIWSAALGRADIGPDRDFFELGGDSLSAVEIVTRIGDVTGSEIAIGALLDHPTPRRLAHAMGWSSSSDTDPMAEDGAGVRIVQLSPGRSDGPIVVMTPAWDDVFGYQALAEALADGGDVTVVAASVDERAHHLSTVNEFVTAVMPSITEAVRGRRPVVVLGWSVGGVVAAELAERLAAAGTSAAFVAAVDTYFPGQQREMWSNRWWKYKSMLRVGAVGEAARELRIMGGRRVRRLVERLGKRLVVWSGGELPDEPERTSVGGFPVAALDHPIDRMHTPLVFFAADTTNPERTIVHWERVADDIEIVPIHGRHRGFASVMAADRVHQIADDLRRRLGV